MGHIGDSFNPSSPPSISFLPLRSPSFQPGVRKLQTSASTPPACLHLLFFAVSTLILATPRIIPRLQTLFSSLKFQKPLVGGYSTITSPRPTGIFGSTALFATATYSTFKPILTHPSDLTMAKYANPPQAPPLFTGTKESIVTDAKVLCDNTRALLDKLVADIKPSDTNGATFDTVVRPQAEDENESALGARILGFYQYVSGDSALRDASTEAEKIMDEFGIEVSMREDVFSLVDAIYSRSGLKESKDVNPDRLIDATLAESTGFQDAEARCCWRRSARATSRTGWACPQVRREIDSRRSSCAW